MPQELNCDLFNILLEAGLKLGLISDIHGNSRALSAVLDSARERGIEALCIAGDYVGYYYHPGEVIDLLAEWTCWRVQGNHERMLAALRVFPGEFGWLRDRFGSGLLRALDELDDERLDELETLPERLAVAVGGRGILIAHGSPWDGDQYVYPDAPEAVWQELAACGADLVVLGHTHYQMQRRVANTLIVNPGSVGQPRDGRCGACWAAFDTETGECELLVETYDVDTVIAEAQRFDPDKPYLALILRRVCVPC